LARVGLAPRVRPAAALVGAFAVGAACGATGPAAEPAAVCPAPTAGVEVGGFPPEADVSPAAARVVVIMGGSSEDDSAARRFVEAANGGDVLILRASGSLTSYPSYFRDLLAPSPAPNSVETVKTTEPSAAAQPAVLCRIGNAEAIWLAGGSQSDYLLGWPPAVHAALAAARDRGVAIGGTSAGAVSLGEAAFDAAEGSVTSGEALANPMRSDVSLSYPTWAQPELALTYVDSHFMDRDREGRLLAFLARFVHDRGHARVVGIGLDERVAMVIEDGSWSVHAPAGKAAWVYELGGSGSIPSAEPLDLTGIRRIELTGGAEGAWPIDVGAHMPTPIRVEGGVVVGG
jgi:cyanophycinase-like exopeptidase